MGSDSRYDRDRPVGDREAAEARALHTIADLLAGHPGLVTDRMVAGQIAHVLHNTAIELDAGRPVPIGRAGRHTARGRRQPRAAGRAQAAQVQRAATAQG